MSKLRFRELIGPQARKVSLWGRRDWLRVQPRDTEWVQTLPPLIPTPLPLPLPQQTGRWISGGHAHFSLGSGGLFPDALCSLCPQEPCSLSRTLPSCLSWFHLGSSPGNPTLQPKTPKSHLSHPRAVVPHTSAPLSAHHRRVVLALG